MLYMCGEPACAWAHACGALSTSPQLLLYSLRQVSQSTELTCTDSLLVILGDPALCLQGLELQPVCHALLAFTWVWGEVQTLVLPFVR